MGIDPSIGRNRPQCTAANAGLQPGDTIRELDGTPVRNFSEFRDYVRARPGQEIELVVRRGDSDLTRKVTASSDDDGGKTVGRLHIKPADVSVPYPPEMRTQTDVGFLGALPSDQPLIVQTVVPTVASGQTTAPTEPLVISAPPVTDGQAQTALVIDSRGLPSGTVIQLQNVSFAAVIGAVNLFPVPAA